MLPWLSGLEGCCCKGVAKLSHGRGANAARVFAASKPANHLAQSSKVRRTYRITERIELMLFLASIVRLGVYPKAVARNVADTPQR